MSALSLQAQKAVNNMFLERAMHGGDYVDIDFGQGGLLSERARKKVAKEGAAKNILNDYRRRWRAMNGTPGSFKNPLFYNSYCKYVNELNRHTGYCNKLANKSIPNMGPMRTPVIPKDIIDRIAMKNIQEANLQAFSQPYDLRTLSSSQIPSFAPGIFSESDIYGPNTMSPNTMSVNDLFTAQQGTGDGILLGGVVKRRKTTKRKTATGRGNPWSKFITAWARKHGKTLTQAMKSAQAKKEYCTWIGKSRKSLGVTKGKKCHYAKKASKSQLTKRKRVDTCLRKKGKKATLASIMKCRAAGILV